MSKSGRPMNKTWGEWKHYPNVMRGEYLEASPGPGVYEVRYISSGGLFAFGATANLAEALSHVAKGKRSFLSFLKPRENVPLHDLEYRTWATATTANAKSAMAGLIGRREAYMRSAA